MYWYIVVFRVSQLRLETEAEIFSKQLITFKNVLDAGGALIDVIIIF